jgi:hypothetical protein
LRRAVRTNEIGSQGMTSPMRRPSQMRTGKGSGSNRRRMPNAIHVGQYRGCSSANVDRDFDVMKG